MRRVKRARTPFFFRYCFTFERSSLWGKEKKRKKRKKEERKVCLESANEISPSRKELLRRFSLNWGLESGIFHSSRDCFNRLIHRESDWATSYSPIFEIVALRRWTTTNEKSRRIFFFFLFRRNGSTLVSNPKFTRISISCNYNINFATEQNPEPEY